MKISALPAHRAWTLSAALLSGLLATACSSDDSSTTPADTGSTGVPDTVGSDGSDATDGTDLSDGTDGDDLTDTTDGDDLTDGTDGDGDVIGGTDGDQDTTTGDDDTGGGDAADVILPTIECGTDSAAALGACADSAKFAADLAVIAKPRMAGTAHHKVVQDLCAERLESLGYTVERQNYGSGTNVIGRINGTSQPEQLVVVGAHYDGVPGCAAADDNGSGTAGVLEAARLLAMTPHARTLVVACWDEEELGLVGSRNWVRQAVKAGERIVVDLTLEMIGYYSDEPNSQTLPQGFELVFAAAAKKLKDNQSRGDFIALIADESAAVYTKRLEDHGAAYGMPTLNATVTNNLIDAAVIGDLRRSDHAGFWDERIPALMITDTANFRNANYHCGGGVDSADTVDAARATKVVSTVVAAAAETLAAGEASEGSTGRVPACTLADGCAANEKCGLANTGVNKWLEKCYAVPAEKVAKNGECARPAGTFGEDTCDAGLFCAYWGMPQSEPQKRQCLSLCNSAADCGEGEACVLGSPTVTRLGMCMKQCDPFADSCGQGLACRYWGPRAEDGATINTCLWTNTGPEGTPCDPTFGTDCESGLNCVVSTETGTAECRAYCDADHPCPANRQCVPDRSVPAHAGLGFCQP